MSYPSTILADTPQSYWRLGDTTTTLADSSGNGLNGTYSGTYTQSQASLVSDASDHSVLFGGGHALVTTMPGFASGAARSWECWVQFTSAGAGPFVILYDGVKWLGVASGILDFNGTVQGSTAINDNARHHVVLTLSAAGVIKTYIDTVLQATSASGSSWLSALNFEIADLGGFPFPGVIDEVAVYPVELTPTQINNHFAAAASASFVVSGPNSATTLPSNHAGNISLALTGTGTNWVAQTFGLTTPPSGWAKVSQAINSTTSVTLVVSCPAAASPPAGPVGTLTVTDGTLSANISIATPTLAISPTSGTTGTTPTLTMTGASTLWASETAAGLFTESGGTGASIGVPSGITNTGASDVLTVGSAAATLTITDTSTGAKTTFAASAGPQTIPVTNANVFWSPGGWDSDGAGSFQANYVRGSSTFARTANPGNYVKLALTSDASGYLKLNLDTTSLSGLDVPNCPTLVWTVNGSAQGTFSWNGTTLTPSGNAALLAYSASPVQIQLASGLSNGVTYQVVLDFRGVAYSGSGVGNTWTDLSVAGSNCVKITGFEIDGGSTMAAPTLLAKRGVVFGDSITAGADSAGGGNLPGSMDATITFARLIAHAFGAEVGVVGWSGQGYTASGFGNVPTFPLAYGLFAAGRSRLASGALPFACDYVWVNQGTNDGGADLTTLTHTAVTNLRAIAPAAKLFFEVPPGRLSASSIAAGVTASADAGAFTIDSGINYITPQYSVDATHPNAIGHATIAADDARLMQSAIGGGGASGGGLSRILTGM